MEFYSSHHHQQKQQHQQQQQVGACGSMASGAVADAATVAIAKDMLQLHHGGAVVTNADNLQHGQQAGVLTPAPAQIPDNALGMLKFESDLLYIIDSCTIIGRNSSTSHVHFHVAENNLVSRKHFQVLFDVDSKEFFVQCLSKNGIFVDDFLQRRNADPLKLPKTTEIRIMFESFVSSPPSPTNIIGSLHSMGNHSGEKANIMITSGTACANSHTTANLMPLEASNIYSPLKISIPKKEQKSPYLSPTGTISAANSCPASPRQGFHQTTNYNNYSNNNLQNQDLFQTPSTASYNHNEKPPYSYAQLIVQAISAAPEKQLTLSGIYSFIVKHYPYYRKETNKGWQNSIRHNLSLNRYFIKVARSQDEPGKGSFWRIDPDSGAKLIDHSYKKRRQRSSQSFRPSYGMPRSAPVSPSHMDNSRESSPLQDIVLQSAPGSPGISIENRAAEDLIYGNQNMHQQPTNNSHQQYNSGSPYYQSQSSAMASVVGQAHAENNGGVGALIAIKRNHGMAASTPTNAKSTTRHQKNQQQHLHHQQQQHHHHHHQLHNADVIYEKMPTDYSGNMESSEECEAAKRPKYVSDAL